MSNQTTENYLIIWQKWFDPFGSDEEQNIELVSTDSEEKFTNNYEDDIESDESHIHSKPIRAIATPMGLIPYNENTASGKIFNFWIGHTNFSITKEISDLIEASHGVEALDIFTRYRFRIAIGKAFDGSKVMKHINDKVYKYLGHKDGISHC
jgi:hypothetical protein